MTIKKGFALRDVCGEQVLIATGIENIDFNHLISLNETAAFLWGTAASAPSFSIALLTKHLVAAYDVSPSTAQADVAHIITLWCELGLIEV